MPPRRPEPTAAAKARAARISAALEGILDDLPPPPQEEPAPSSDGHSAPYRPMPASPAKSGRREGVDCPACQNPMELDFDRGVEIHRCISCAGLWLDPGELDTMVDDPGPAEANVADLREGMKDLRVPTGPVRYRKCPRCKLVMARRNFGSHSGVIVDECRQHGMYLDPGEFEAIEAFIKLGGLALERSRELRNAKRAVHRAQLDAEHYRAAATAVPQHDHHHHHHGSSWGSIFSWLDGLFT
ncbi:MAG: zf-TFIIB domain-containing protein [Nannocystaceae bacterium]|nr:zf-TFIIB domain-containing protein [Nannocystaceae bacterium]